MKQLVLLFLLLLQLPAPGRCQSSDQPVIDMHLHAYAGRLGIPNPNTGKVLVQTADQHRIASLRFMTAHNVVLGAVSANEEPETALEVLSAWENEAGGKLLRGLFLGKRAGYPPVESVRAWIKAGKIDFLGEMGFQYDGRSPSEPELFEYYELAQELDVPVAIHTGMSAPGTPLRCCPKFRLSLGNPYLLEDLLVRFPRLRVWAMHAGGQHFNEMVTMMKMYPRLHVDISPYTWLNAGNAELLDRFLRLAKEQGVLDRVMFGSDQMRWPEAIETAVHRVKSIDYLSDQEKRGILYDNAARFLRLTEDEIARHHGRALVDVALDRGREKPSDVGGPATPAASRQAEGLRERILENHFRFVPSGKGPFATIVAVPGCSGIAFPDEEAEAGHPDLNEDDRLFRRHYLRMAQRLRGEGFAVLLIHVHGAEGLVKACAGEIAMERIAQYIDEAVAWARGLDFVDPTRIHVVGWSMGGGGTLTWLHGDREQTGSVRSVVSVYPACSGRQPLTNEVPLLMLLGGADDITSASVCEDLLAASRTQPKITVRSYPGARHGFDIADAPPVMDIGNGMTIGHQREAAEAAWEEILAFLSEGR